MNYIELYTHVARWQKGEEPLGGIWHFITGGMDSLLSNTKNRLYTYDVCIQMTECEWNDSGYRLTKDDLMNKLVRPLLGLYVNRDDILIIRTVLTCHCVTYVPISHNETKRRKLNDQIEGEELGLFSDWNSVLPNENDSMIQKLIKST